MDRRPRRRCDVAQWKAHFNSAPSEVYRALSTADGRSRFWATSAHETGGVIQFVLSDGRADETNVVRAVHDQLYELHYFGRTLTFTLTPDDAGGTDLTLACDAAPNEYDADHVSLLLRLKAFVDHGVDLRNHDTTRVTHYVDT
jgi:uncharacterized protein YndB with AHSA1/START domain